MKINVSTIYLLLALLCLIMQVVVIGQEADKSHQYMNTLLLFIILANQTKKQ